MSTASAQGGALGTIVDRMGLKTLVESCLVLEEGVASATVSYTHLTLPTNREV